MPYTEYAARETGPEKTYGRTVDKKRALAYTEGKFIIRLQEFIMSASVFTLSFAGQWWWRIFSSGRGCGLDV